MVKFGKHLRNVSNEISQSIGLLRKLQDILPRPALLTIYNCFIRPHLDYGDIIYDQAYKLSFHQETEPTQYNVALAIAGEIRGRSKLKLYQELGLESLQLRRLNRELHCFYKIYNKQAPVYLTGLIPHQLSLNKLDPSFRNSASYNAFKNSIFKFVRHSPYKVFHCHNPKESN